MLDLSGNLAAANKKRRAKGGRKRKAKRPRAAPKPKKSRVATIPEVDGESEARGSHEAPTSGAESTDGEVEVERSHKTPEPANDEAGALEDCMH